MAFVGTAVGIGGAIAGTVGTGLAAVGGGSAMAGAMTVGGLGMSAMSMFGSSSGSAPSSKIRLTKRGKQLESAVYKQANRRWADATQGKLDDNLVSPIIANIRRQYQSQSRASQAAISTEASRTATGDVLSSGKMAKMSLEQATKKLQEAYAPVAKRHELQREQMNNALNLNQNILNLEKQTPLLRAQSMFAKGLLGQAENQQAGSVLGSIAQMGGMMGFNSAQSKYLKGY